MRRRGFITLLGGAAAWPVRALQPGALPTIVYCNVRSKSASPLAAVTVVKA
jgi:hypothetical protein